MTPIPSALLTTTGPRGSEPSLAYAPLLEREGYRVDQVLIPEASSIRQLLSTLSLGPRVRNYDLIVANEYSTAIGLGLLANLFRARARMVVLSLNLSRRPFSIGATAIQRIFDRALRRYDAIVVHSSPEVASFVELHNLDPARFQVIPWGFDLPAFDRSQFPGLPPCYVCVIGRNNRDFESVEKALAGTGIAGVFVGAGQPHKSGDPQILSFQSLPSEDCLKIMSGALANVIAVQDSSRGAGHITAVSGMMLGKPHIFSDVETLREYLDDERDGIAVPLGDAAALGRAVRRLASDSALAARMGEQGRQHALLEMTHAKFMDRIVNVMLDRPAGAGRA
jgi:glycosyltransferase involved in cell wall biosynthesis